MVNIINVIAHLTKRSLVLFDAVPNQHLINTFPFQAIINQAESCAFNINNNN